MPYGLTVKHGSGGDRMELQCAHHNGVLYVVPGQGSWVCSPEHLHAHALAGFFKELTALGDPRVQGLLWRWGLSFRERPLEPAPSQQAGSQQPSSSSPS